MTKVTISSPVKTGFLLGVGYFLAHAGMKVIGFAMEASLWYIFPE